ncbi:saccharopine dehydrogenase family protein [Leucobacter japonicus]|uniref:saccharopine dehydrogenase family protein n=1 Tax=Leucobacter japonicus TaxID=1461259 RepID=UPI0006A75DEA|nr:saccharopine dehydrogenase NADP-binding domain-containing protein [Leucobacter japonicus]
MSKKTIAVLGAGGAQASGVLRGLGRAPEDVRILACDRQFRTPDNTRAGEQEVELIDFDLIAEPDRLRAILSSADLVINCTGPYYTLGPIILDAAIAAGTDYVDICDDADATELLLARGDAAKAAGVTALIGMGSAPGTTNVLVRLALDALPDEEASVEISWCVDANDMVGAVVPHFAHSFSTALPEAGANPGWEDLEPRRVVFPEPIGEQLVLTLSHPEVMTLPRFTRAKRVVNRGGLIPEDFTHLGWVLSRTPESVDRARTTASVFETVRSQYAGREATGSGLIVDVRVGADGIRFLSGGKMSQDDATGTPAAAGALLSLDGAVPGPGVVSPEVLNPADFFTRLRDVSAGGGGMTAYRTRDGEITERARIRDLLAAHEMRTAAPIA